MLLLCNVTATIVRIFRQAVHNRLPKLCTHHSLYIPIGCSHGYSIPINRFRNNVLNDCFVQHFCKMISFILMLCRFGVFFRLSFDGNSLSYVWRPYGRINRKSWYDTVIMTIRRNCHCKWAALATYMHEIRLSNFNWKWLLSQ